jgi:hypothetical protein
MRERWPASRETGLWAAPLSGSGRGWRIVTTLVTGIYRDGKIELLETPMGVREGRARVLLTQDEEPRAAPQYLVRGKYKGSKDPTLDDFRDAEWHGEPEFDDLRGP